MPAHSPGVERVAAILHFMAEHPDRAVTVSDLVRAVKISRSTCHTLVSSLVHVGFLHRTSDKTYVLGPSLALIGQIAVKHASPVLIAQPEMRALADEFDVICSAIFREADDLVVRERAASGSSLGWSSPKGTRLRMQPAFAGIFYAWSPHAQVEAWLRTAAPSATDEQKALMSRAMTFARSNGFIFSVRNARFAESLERPVDPFEEGLRDLPVFLVPELAAEREYPLAAVVSPVFDAAHEVVFLLTLGGFTQMVSGSEVAHIGHRLRSVCEHISSFIGRARPAG
jgi:DNA-binding IclR family transcriptional regulator